ncbi:MAG TPA: hypothetical protein VKH42_15865 [Vicinamibacterales bacterium]|nr:hypothetical protein [Vicinamibacterales bacterium]
MIAIAAGNDNEREIDEPRNQVDQTEPGDRAANEVVDQQRLQRRPRQREIVPLPERRPRQDDEQKSDFEKKGDVNETTDQNYPRACTFESRSIRCSTSS